MAYERKAIYTIEHIMKHQVDRVRGKKIKKDFDGDMVRVDSDRLETFKKKGFKCVYCGTEGIYFAKERTHDQEAYHFNLYGIDNEGNEVLMTKDHIIPKSKGGSNHINNYQTMCTHCNKQKGNIYETISNGKTD